MGASGSSDERVARPDYISINCRVPFLGPPFSQQVRRVFLSVPSSVLWPHLSSACQLQMMFIIIHIIMFYCLSATLTPRGLSRIPTARKLSPVDAPVRPFLRWAIVVGTIDTIDTITPSPCLSELLLVLMLAHTSRSLRCPARFLSFQLYAASSSLHQGETKEGHVHASAFPYDPPTQSCRSDIFFRNAMIILRHRADHHVQMMCNAVGS